MITARAIATRCCSPPDSVGGRALARSASPTQASISRTGPRLLVARAGYPQRKRDIVERGQMPDQAEVLEHDADPAAEGRQRVARGLGQLLAEQAYASARRPLREVEQLEKRRLPRARRAGEEIESAVGEPEIEVAQHLGARAVAQADAVEFGNRRHWTPLTRPHRKATPCQAPSIPVYLRLPSRKRAFESMILTCPNCGTQYVVKDGAFLPTGARYGAPRASTAGTRTRR